MTHEGVGMKDFFECTDSCRENCIPECLEKNMENFRKLNLSDDTIYILCWGLCTSHCDKLCEKLLEVQQAKRSMRV